MPQCSTALYPCYVMLCTISLLCRFPLSSLPSISATLYILWKRSHAGCPLATLFCFGAGAGPVAAPPDRKSIPPAFAKICLFLRWTGMVPSGVPGIVFSSFYSHVFVSSDIHVGRQEGMWDSVARGIRTRLAKTHWLSGRSTRRHCQSWWLLFSRQSQCRLNSSRQCLLMSVNLFPSSH
jgi:hypothetical protein